MCDDMRLLSIGDEVFHSKNLGWGVGKILCKDKDNILIRFRTIGEKNLRYNIKERDWELVLATKERRKQFQPQTTKYLHKKYLESKGILYEGVSVSFKSVRNTHCYSCKEKISTYTNLICNSCNWIICNCGACGCGYSCKDFH